MGSIEKRICREAKQNALCFVLLDSESLSDKMAVDLVKKAENAGASAILVGGSSTIDQIELNQVIASIKKTIQIPTILFPGNVTGISPMADAILFSSLLNSENPYFITQAQALGAIAVKKHNIEAIPMAYIIIGEGSSAWFVGRARGIPFDKPKLAVMYALAAQYMGMRSLYLEAGSGALHHVKPEMVTAVRKNFNGLLIVGGGIRDVKTAREIAQAGADIIVIGTAFEKTSSDKLLRAVIKAIVSVKRRLKDQT
ncbi:MAG: geranylgeranylglyceryl/heptaprenylglyceryl phosphate synthase [Thaumarchaeota archaeon]|nr:geranylgeranylglyceryl/heptaprenylglyceryl phosphate synthase [Nitrososphaerota archaeon]